MWKLPDCVGWDQGLTVRTEKHKMKQQLQVGGGVLAAPPTLSVSVRVAAAASEPSSADRGAPCGLQP